jgi:Tol biopolymer transport system component
MVARTHAPRDGRAGGVALLAALAIVPLATAQSTPALWITERDRTSHPEGESVGIEVVLDVGPWRVEPPPTGTIRVGDPARPDADCVITLPASPPLGCLWRGNGPGVKQLVATYSGDATYAPLTSAPVEHLVVPPGQPERVTLPDPAVPDRNAPRQSSRAVTSADGRWIAFVSAEPRLTDDPRPVSFDHALLFDRHTGRTRRMSNAADGSPADSGIERVAISGDGRFVAFLTRAMNLDAGDEPGTRDWFVADKETGAVQRLPALRVFSTSSEVGLRVALSHDGRYVAFESERGDLAVGDGNDAPDVFRLDRQTNAVLLVSRNGSDGVGNAASTSPAISADGRLVAFASAASDLVPGDTNGSTDVFVRDLDASTTERSSVTTAGAQVSAAAALPALSPDGRFVAFGGGDGFVPGDNDGRFDIFVRDRVAGTTTWASPDPPTGTLGEVFGPTVSADGTRVAFRGLTSNRLHLFDATMQTVATLGAGTGFAPNAAVPESLQVSADGRSVVFDSGQPSLVADDRNGTADVFAYDVATAAIHRVSGIRLTGAASGSPYNPPALSDDGAIVAFSSFAGNLVPGDINGGGDVFVRDRLARRTELVSRVPGGGTSFRGVAFDAIAVSGNGRFVAFSSTAPDLTPPDGGNANNIFLRDRQGGMLRMISRRPNGQPSSGSQRPSISRDGRWVAFQSADSLLAEPPISGDKINIFLHDTQTGATTVVPPGGVGLSGQATDARLSGDGRFVVFTSTSNSLVPGDTNGLGDVFLYDRVASTTRRLSVSATGAQANGSSGLPEISADGRTVAFVSLATNLVPDQGDPRAKVLVVDLQDGSIERADVGPGGSQASGTEFPTRPELSADGRFVAFDSDSNDLVPGPGPRRDAYVRDRVSGETRRVVTRLAGATHIDAERPAISADGRSIVVYAAGALGAGGARHAVDAFVVENPFPPELLFGNGFEGP